MVFEEMKNLVHDLREEAEIVRLHEGDGAADRINRFADRLEDHIEEVRTRELTPQEAARECSWSQHTISRRIGKGLFGPESSREKGNRSVRRCDLYAVVHREERPGGSGGIGEPDLEVMETEGPDLANDVLTGMES